MKKPKIYISGKISNCSNFYELFEASEDALQNEWHVINPCKIHDSCLNHDTWKDFMLCDIEALFDCDAIFMLSNWQESKGARIEHSIAKELNLKILFQHEKTKEEIEQATKSISIEDVIELDENGNIKEPVKEDEPDRTAIPD